MRSARNRWDKHLKPRFAQLLPEHIDRALCRRYVGERRDAGVSDWTIRREMGILRSGVLWHDKRTKAVFELPPEGKSRERYLTREEFQALLDGARMPHVRLFIAVALATAGRMGAILDLTWDRVDFKHGTIALANGQHKVKGRATVPMTPEVRIALEEAYKGRTSNYVIEYGGEKVASIKKGVGEAARRAKLDGVSAHVLRHTAAVWMASAGVSLDKIAQFMGHTDTRMTYKHYARFSPTHLADAASALSLGGSK